MGALTRSIERPSLNYEPCFNFCTFSWKVPALSFQLLQFFYDFLQCKVIFQHVALSKVIFYRLMPCVCRLTRIMFSLSLSLLWAPHSTSLFFFLFLFFHPANHSFALIIYYFSISNGTKKQNAEKLSPVKRK